MTSPDYVMVPREPTEEMLDFGSCYEDPADRYSSDPVYPDGQIARDVYRAMIAHAPPVTPLKSSEVGEMVEMTREDANNLDDVVHELEIADSFETPAEAVRKLKAAITSLVAERGMMREALKAIYDTPDHLPASVNTILRSHLREMNNE